ncbi:porin [Hyphobacterium sp. HN65]|uniref:Porin n=1 Tax=Hyphobacterium lacteum TaxID=3116575 RepID=A0ABU7LNN7_9PROT|nr:porin [Hyphobacterium sp. HN65]MEE2525533.1 porin [Hyphobacterium sp. HN65]
MKSILAGGVAALAFACGAFADGPVFHAAPEWEDPETGNSFKLRGRLYFDVAFGNVDTTGRNESYSASEMRTGRLGVEGSWYNFEYKAEFDFADNSVDAKDVYIEWDGGDFSVIIGHQKTPNSLEEQTSSRYITFMERGQITDAFRLDRRLGIAIATGGDNYSFRAGLFGGSVNEDNSGSSMSESMAVAARLTFTPINTDNNVLHLGVSGRYYDRGDNSGTAVRVRSRPNVHLAERLVDVNTGADQSTLFGLEAAWISGPFHAHAEYMSEDADGSADDFQGYFVNLGWFLTGEQRAYRASSGAFRRTSPSAPVSGGGGGAWELAGRYDYLDTDSGGSLTTYTAGVNWYPEAYVRFMLNVVVGDVEGTGARLGEGDFNAVQARAQIDW